MGKVRLSQLKADTRIWVFTDESGSLCSITSLTHFLVPKHNQPGAFFKPLGLHGKTLSTNQEFVEIDLEKGKDTYAIEVKTPDKPD